MTTHKPKQQGKRKVRIYVNPANEWQTWSSNRRGQRPAWLVAWLERGGSLESLERK